MVEKRIVIQNNFNNLRVLDIIIKSRTITSVYYTEHFDTFTQLLNAFSSRYEIMFSKITELDDDRLLNELEIKLIKVYNAIKNKQKHPVLVKYILYFYSTKVNLPMYKLPIRRIYYSNEYSTERELSVHAFINSTYRLLPLFEKL